METGLQKSLSFFSGSFVELLVAAVFLIIAVLVALFRGSVKSKLRLAGVIFSAVMAFIATLVFKASAVSDKVLSYLNGYQIAGAGDLTVAEMIDQVAKYSPSLEKLLLGSTAALLAPIVFLALFIAFLVVTWAIFFIVTLLLFPLFRKWEGKTHFKKVQSLVTGIIQGVLVMVLVLAPINYYAQIVEEIIPELEKNGIISDVAESNGISEEDIGSLYTGGDSILLDLSGSMGGNALCGTLSSFKYTDNSGNTVKVNFEDEIVPMFRIAANIVKLSGTPLEQFSEEEAKAIEDIGSGFSESPLLKTVSCELIHGLTGAWKDDVSYATLKKPEIGDPAGPVFDHLISIFYESSASEALLGRDVQDVSKIVAVMVKADIMRYLNDTSNMVDKLANSSATKDVTAILRENERLSPLITDVTNLSVYVLAQSMGVPGTESEVYVDMLENIAQKLNETDSMEPAERIESLKSFVSAELYTAGIDVDEEYIELVSTALVNDFGDFEGEITPEFISEFFTIYNENRNAESGENTDISYAGNSGVVLLGASDGRNFTFPGYLSEVGRSSSGAALIGKLDSEIRKITESDNPVETKIEEVKKIIGEIMAPVHINIVEKSEDKERAEQFVLGSIESVSSVSEKSIDRNILNSDNLASLTDAENANINCMTLNKIKEKFSVTKEITDADEAEKHGQVIEDVLKCASAILSAKKDEGTEEQNKTNVEAFKAATEGIGSLFDSLSETKLYGGDDTSDLMKSLLNSNTLSSATGITKSEVKDIVENVKSSEELTYSSLMNGVTGMVDLIFSMTEGNCTLESVESLVRGLDESNTEAIMVLVTEERFANIGITGEKIAPTKELMTALLTELGKVSEDRVEAEAKAVKKLVDVALEAKSAEGSGLFGENGRLGSATEFIEEILQSEAVCNTLESASHDPFGVAEKIKEPDKQEFIDAYAQYAKGEHADTVKALANVLGIDVE